MEDMQSPAAALRHIHVFLLERKDLADIRWLHVSVQRKIFVVDISHRYLPFAFLTYAMPPLTIMSKTASRDKISLRHDIPTWAGTRTAALGPLKRPQALNPTA